jgi:hypothetical protein
MFPAAYGERRLTVMHAAVRACMPGQQQAATTGLHRSMLCCCCGNLDCFHISATSSDLGPISYERKSGDITTHVQGCPSSSLTAFSIVQTRAVMDQKVLHAWPATGGTVLEHNGSTDGKLQSACSSLKACPTVCGVRNLLPCTGNSLSTTANL